MRFHPGVEYRHLCVVPKDWADAECTPPHDLTGRAAVFPTGPAAPKVRALMDASRARSSRRRRATVGCDSDADLVVGPRRAARRCRRSSRRTASRAACRRPSTSCKDSVCSPGSTSSTFPARPRASTTTTARRRARASRSLDDRDLFVLHVEATDEAGHQGRVDIKVDALERWDREIIGPIVDALDAAGEPYRILLLPDHATPCTRMTHTAEAVPYLLFDSTRVDSGGVYTEAATAHCAPVPAHELMGRLVAP